MLEEVVENYLVKRVKENGGEIRKLKWVGRRSAPDRLVLLRGVYFVELKRPGKEAEPDQAREHKRMRKHGAKVFTLDTKDLVDVFIDAVLGDNSKWHKII